MPVSFMTLPSGAARPHLPRHNICATLSAVPKTGLGVEKVTVPYSFNTPPRCGVECYLRAALSKCVSE